MTSPDRKKIEDVARALAAWLRSQPLPQIAFPPQVEKIIGGDGDLDFFHQYFDEISLLLEDTDGIGGLLYAFLLPVLDPPVMRVMYFFYPAKAKPASARP